jgi:hypothetical protein
MRTMSDHVRLLAILNLVWSGLGILIGLIVLLAFGGVAGAVGLSGISTADNPDNALFVMPVLAVIGVFVLVIVCLVAGPAIVGSLGLLKLAPWARVLMIIISIFQLLNFPIGTALGVYGLWVLFHEETKPLFGLPGRAYMPPPVPSAGGHGSNHSQ